MKKFLSIFMSIVMLLSITAGVDLSAKAEYDNIFNAYDYKFGETYYGCTTYYNKSDYLKFVVPVKGEVTITFYAYPDGPYGSEEYANYGICNSKGDILSTSRVSENRNLGCCYKKESKTYSPGIYYFYNYFDYYFQDDYADFNVKITYKPSITAPSNVKVSSNSESAFTVNWSKVANVDGYLIKYATKSDFSNAAYAKVANGKTTSKTINGRAANTKYYVKVQAYKKVNEVTYKSKWSETKTVKTLEKKAYIKSISSRANGFTVKWDKVNGKLGYQIRYATKPDFSNAATIYAGNGNATSKTITGRAARKKYYVQIRSYVKQNGKYKFDSWSPTKTVTTK